MKSPFALITVGVLSVLNGLVIQKENLIRNASSIYLKLAPVDPRSLMQGDYMRLNYDVLNQSRLALLKDKPVSDGFLVVRVDERGVGLFQRIDDGNPLAANERRLHFRHRNWQTRIGAESYFFQEGHGDRFQHAQYGELKVSDSGECVLIGLRDSELRLIDTDYVQPDD